ncbi:MAG TPA: DUF92 domain-containing protein [Bacteroidota bacterium]|nr:DUF92 domain-containing protein [Bacteroidota bacterium]
MTSLLPAIHLLIFGLLLGIIAGVLSYYFHFLTRNGAIAAAILGSILYIFGEWRALTPMLTFFIFSSALTKFTQRKQPEISQIFEKSGPRDAVQVLANGGIAGLMIIMSFFVPNLSVHLAYLGSISAVTADTWGTELGMLFRGKTFHITNLKKADPGMSGAVSLQGTIGSVIGALLISIYSFFFVPEQAIKYSSIIVAAGLAGSFVDSLMGALFQAQYQCPACYQITERTNHCNLQTELVRGKVWITNDIVNFVCSIVGAITSFSIAEYL